MTDTLEAETIDLAQVECCNTCEHGERKYFGDSDIPLGIRCLEEQPNEEKFDYKCDLYRPDIGFIRRNEKINPKHL